MSNRRMGNRLKTAMGIVGLVFATQAAAQVTFYSRDDFRGQSFTTDREIRNMERQGFNDRASSAVVRGGSWQVCEDARFEGRCVVLQPGDYPSLADMGLSNEISSVRAVEGRYGYNNDNRRYVARNDYARRTDEPVFEARVTSVRAVVGPPEQRCWVERRDFSGNANVPGAIAGAVIGGILGHQIGGGRGQDIATAGGAVAGAAIGSNVGRDGGGYSQDVQRCTDVSRSDNPDYWDVTYEFRGSEHRVQMSAPPGPTILVNRDGEPRV
ncbi:MAG: beta/gamma crystallin-related protein [Betaproteobacteria bacterium]|nr:beta/gamma crystallin-related protein [Casimicrobiaceae bacterium]